MTQPQDPRTTPLQDDEVELARVLRALPAGEPSAKVDAAILAAATDALNRRAPAPTVAPRRAAKTARWALPTWAIGTAAAAVLAVGIGMQLRPPLSQEPEQATAPAARQELPEARERLSVELVEPEAAPLPQMAPPPSATDDVLRRAPAPAPPPPPPAPVVPESPAPASVAADAFPIEAAVEAAPEPESDAATLDSVEVTGSRIKPTDEAGDRARRAHQDLYATRAQAEAADAEARQQAYARREAEAQAKAAQEAPLSFGETAAGAGAPAAAAPAPAPYAAPAPARDDAANVLPPVADDARLPPGDWLERIRERLRQDDRAGARASLQRFLQTHPDVPVPADLEPLR